METELENITQPMSETAAPGMNLEAPSVEDQAKAELEYPELKFPLLVQSFNGPQKAKTLLALCNRQIIGFDDFPVGYEEAVGYETMLDFMSALRQELRRVGFFSRAEQQLATDEVDYDSWRIIYGRRPASVRNYQPGLSSLEDGEILGFPETASKAFPARSLKHEDLPPEIRNHPLSKYLPFLPSKDHVYEEWQWFVEELTKAAKQYPELAHEFQIARWLKM